MDADPANCQRDTADGGFQMAERCVGSSEKFSFPVKKDSCPAAGSCFSLESVSRMHRKTRSGHLPAKYNDLAIKSDGSGDHYAERLEAKGEL